MPVLPERSEVRVSNPALNEPSCRGPLHSPLAGPYADDPLSGHFELEQLPISEAVRTAS